VLIPTIQNITQYRRALVQQYNYCCEKERGEGRTEPTENKRLGGGRTWNRTDRKILNRTGDRIY
jgi:hypothetical protein